MHNIRTWMSASRARCGIRTRFGIFNPIKISRMTEPGKAPCEDVIVISKPLSKVNTFQQLTRSSYTFLPIHSHHHVTTHNNHWTRWQPRLLFVCASPRELLSGFLIIRQIIFQFHSERSTIVCSRVRFWNCAFYRSCAIISPDKARIARNWFDSKLRALVESVNHPNGRRKSCLRASGESLNGLYNWKRKKSIP